MDISGQGLMWYARPQLFFNCTVCPTGQRARKHLHTELSLVFFNTFEPINITPHSVMQRNGVPMLYDTASGSNEPSLYICPVSNVLGSVPLLHCFIAGNKHPTLPHSIGSRQVAVADTRPGAGNGSRLFELTLGCGATGGASQGRSLWLKLRPGGRSGLWHAGSRGQ